MVQILELEKLLARQDPISSLIVFHKGMNIIVNFASFGATLARVFLCYMGK